MKRADLTEDARSAPVSRLIQMISVRKRDPPCIKACKKTVAAYAERTGADLVIRTEMPDPRPYKMPMDHPKFLLYDNLRRFLEGPHTLCMLIDDDILIRSEAPDLFSSLSPDEVRIANSENLGRIRFESYFPEYCKKTDSFRALEGFNYNSGLIVLGRTAAERLLEVSKPPYRKGAIEQRQFNVFLLRSGARISLLPNEDLIHTGPERHGQFLHFCGVNKQKRVDQYLAKHGSDFPL